MKTGQRIAHFIVSDTDNIELYACLWTISFPIIALLSRTNLKVFSELDNNIFTMIYCALIATGVYQLILWWTRSLRIRINVITFIFVLWSFLTFLSSSIGSDPDRIMIYALNALCYLWLMIRTLIENHWLMSNHGDTR